MTNGVASMHVLKPFALSATLTCKQYQLINKKVLKRCWGTHKILSEVRENWVWMATLHSHLGSESHQSQRVWVSTSPTFGFIVPTSR